MANVLDRIMQKVDTDSKEADKAAKAYSNMLVYLKELKLHNVKNLELAEQIHVLSETNVEKLNEIHNIISDRLNDENETEKDALSKIQAAIEELQQKTSIERDNDIRVLKREIAVLNSNIEEPFKSMLTILMRHLKIKEDTADIYAHHNMAPHNHYFFAYFKLYSTTILIKF